MNNATINRTMYPFSSETDTKKGSHFDKSRLIKHIIDNTRGSEPYETQVPEGYYAVVMKHPSFLKEERFTEPAKKPAYSIDILYESTISEPSTKEGTTMMDELQKDVAIIKGDVKYLRRDIDELKGDVKNIATEKLPEIQSDIAVLKNTLNSISSWFKPLVITVIGGVIVGFILYLFKIGPK